MSRRPGKEVAAGGDGRQPAGVRRLRRGGQMLRDAYVSGMDMTQMREEHPIEGSGPRHVHSRHVSMSARREQSQKHQEDAVDDDFDDDDDEDFADKEQVATYESQGSGPYDDYGPFSQRIDQDDQDPEPEPQRVVVAKGRGGRFVSTSASSGASAVSGASRKRARASWMVEGEVPGGPMDGSVIPSFLGHIAVRIWEETERSSENCLLKCQNRDKACASLVKWVSKWDSGSNMLARLMQTGLVHLPASMHMTIDASLITAFVERWQPDTNSFHLPFGEMTIMLHDVEAILGIRAEGTQVAGVSDRDFGQLLAELVGVGPDELYTAELGVWDHGGLNIDEIMRRCLDPSARRHEDSQLSGYLFLVLGCTLFPDKSGNKIRPRDIGDVLYPGTISQFSWGSATLAYLYRQLGFSSRADAAGITGCLTLLQTWIYEYFPSLRPQRDPLPMAEGVSCACRWKTRPKRKSHERLRQLRVQIDEMTPYEVNWLPFTADPSIDCPRTTYMGPIQYRDIVEAYMPQRCIRQLGYVQIIPPPPISPSKAVRSAYSREYVVEWPDNFATTWEHFSMGARLYIHGLEKAPAEKPWSCAERYMEWFRRVSHPKLIPSLVNDHQQGYDDVPPYHAVDAWYGHMLHHFDVFSLQEPFMTDEGKAELRDMERNLQNWNSRRSRR